MDGMTGIKTRHFYNNICNFNDIRYLEIGTYTGSSLCSAICNNKMTCVAIDNWSEFCQNNTKQIFEKNFEKYKGQNNALFIEKNCWSVDITNIGKFNIYMYDGNHDESSHFKALNYYYPCLDDIFIYIVDDWNVPHIQKGTLNSIQKNNLTILFKKEIFNTVREWNVPGGFGKDGDWHNGISIFVLQKTT
jgi:hypothetical protein